ncbi:hypothetical protein GCM10009099_22110 [Caenispirillum bisanense]
MRETPDIGAPNGAPAARGATVGAADTAGRCIDIGMPRNCMKASDPNSNRPSAAAGRGARAFLLPNDGSPIRTAPHRGCRTRGDTSGKQGTPPTAEIRLFTIAAAGARHNGLLPLHTRRNAVIFPCRGEECAGRVGFSLHRDSVSVMIRHIKVCA